jgi:hypothetical protein
MLDQASRLADGLIAWECHTGGFPPLGPEKKAEFPRSLQLPAGRKVLTLMRAIRGAHVLRRGEGLPRRRPLPKKSMRLTALRFASGGFKS